MAESKEDRWRAIERKHNANCLWSQIVGNRTILTECLYFPRLHSTVIVTKHYDKPIPRSGSAKPWPDMIGVWVYVPVGGSTWEELDEQLTELERNWSTDRPNAPVEIEAA
jgi:hypothetical protein